jgi:hypothetical protein
MRITFKEWQIKLEHDLQSIFIGAETRQLILAYCLGLISLAKEKEREYCASLAMNNPHKCGMELAMLIRETE